MNVLVHHIQGEESRHQHNGRTAETRGMRGDSFELIAEKIPGHDKRDGPEKGAEAVVQEESSDVDVKQTGKGRRHRAEAGNELGEYERPHSMPDEKILCAAHAGIRFEGNAAE